MYAYFKGKVIKKYPLSNYISLDVNNVGYKILVSSNDYSTVKQKEEYKVYVEQIVSDREINLYGFLDEENLETFNLLITVNGLGPKTALTIFAEYNSKEVKEAIQNANKDFFKSVKGLGNKTALKIIVELQNKLGQLEELDLKESKEDQDLIEALTSMGYDKKLVKESLKAVPKDLPESKKINQLIKIINKS